MVYTTLNLAYSRKYVYYNSKLSLSCNLGKDLRKNEENDQLVKCKDIRLYLLLHIPTNHKK